MNRLKTVAILSGSCIFVMLTTVACLPSNYTEMVQKQMAADARKNLQTLSDGRVALVNLDQPQRAFSIMPPSENGPIKWRLANDLPMPMLFRPVSKANSDGSVELAQNIMLYVSTASKGAYGDTQATFNAQDFIQKDLAVLLPKLPGGVEQSAVSLFDDKIKTVRGEQIITYVIQSKIEQRVDFRSYILNDWNESIGISVFSIGGKFDDPNISKQLMADFMNVVVSFSFGQGNKI